MIASWLRRGRRRDVFTSGIWPPLSITLTAPSHRPRHSLPCSHSPATSRKVMPWTGARLTKVYYGFAFTCRWLTAQRCYVPFLTKLRFWYQVIARAFSHLWTKCEILIRYRNEEHDFNEQFIKLEWMHKGVMSIHFLHEGFKSGRWPIPKLSFTSLMTK